MKDLTKVYYVSKFLNKFLNFLSILPHQFYPWTIRPKKSLILLNRSSKVLIFFLLKPVPNLEKLQMLAGDVYSLKFMTILMRRICTKRNLLNICLKKKMIKILNLYRNVVVKKQDVWNFTANVLQEVKLFIIRSILLWMQLLKLSKFFIIWWNQISCDWPNYCKKSQRFWPTWKD